MRGPASTMVFISIAFAAGKIARAPEHSAIGRGQPRKIHFVILDLTIPGGMGGKDAVRELLKIEPGVRAIVASGYAHDTVMANFRAHGFKAMVSKPFTMQELRQALHEVAVLR